MGRENFLGLMFGMQNNVIYAVGLFQSSDRMRLSWLSFNGSRGARADDACRCEPVHPKKIDNESWFF
jgi:hypothetical protein